MKSNFLMGTGFSFGVITYFGIDLVITHTVNIVNAIELFT